MNLLKRYRHAWLLAVVFVTGAAVLIVEVTAIRILSIYFGNTIYTDSGVIGVILAALALGYARGGAQADRTPTRQAFFRTIQKSALALIILFYLMGLLPLLTQYVPLSWGPLAIAFALFFAPSYFFGMLSPFAIRLGQDEEKHVGTGTMSGRVFFWSTCGSIAGTLLASFVLIPFLGLNAIMFSTTCIVLFLGGIGQILVSGRPRRVPEVVLLAALLIILCAIFYANTRTPPGVLYSKDGIYQRLTIFDGTFAGRPARFFVQDRTDDGVVFLDGTDLAAPYTKYYALYKLFDPNLAHALFIGGGAYSMPTALHRDLPNATIDIAEIEPSLFSVAQKYFGASDDPHLVNHIEDGRRFLAQSTTSYDMIVSDVYYSLYSVPPAYTTEEFFLEARQKLAPNGIFLANFISNLSSAPPSLIFSEIRTMHEVFPNLYVFAVDSPNSQKVQNVIALGVNGDTRLDDLVARSSQGLPPPLPADLLAHIVPLERYDLGEYVLLTDDYAPVEYMIAKTLSVAQ